MSTLLSTIRSLYEAKEIKEELCEECGADPCECEEAELGEALKIPKKGLSRKTAKTGEYVIKATDKNMDFFPRLADVNFQNLGFEFNHAPEKLEKGITQKDDEMEVSIKLNAAGKGFDGKTRYKDAVIKIKRLDESLDLDEGFSPKEIKMAIGIASDPRYKGGNMTGAVSAIEKIKKGLSDHPQVSAVLKRQNESVDLDEAKELTPKAVEDYLVKTGVNPKDAKDAVKKGFGYANKKYGGETYAKALKKVAEVVWSLHEEYAPLEEAYTKQQLMKMRQMLGREGQADKKKGVAIFMDKVGVNSKTAETMWKAAVNEEVELDEAKLYYFIAMPTVEKGKIKKHHSMELKAKSAKEAREKAAKEFGLKPTEVKAVAKYQDDAHMNEKRKYTPPTEAEKKKDKDREAGKGDRMYGKMRGGLKKEEAEMDYDEMFEALDFEEGVVVEHVVKLTLEDTMKLVVLSEASGDKEAYQKFFKSALKKFGVSSPSELDGKKEKEFYDYVDKNWEGDNEKEEQNEAACSTKKKMNASYKKEEDEPKDDEKEAPKKDDSEEEEDGEHKDVGKSGKKMKVAVDPKIEESAEMTSDQEKKREEIVKKLKEKKDEFKKKYGDRWEDVMYATATKLAMKTK